MRTTVDLPPAVDRRVRELAEERGVSLSHMVAELTARGLAQLDSTVEIELHERSGFPMLRIGRRVTSAEVADLIEEDRA